MKYRVDQENTNLLDAGTPRPCCTLHLQEHIDGSVTLRGFFSEGTGYDDILKLTADGKLVLGNISRAIEGIARSSSNEYKIKVVKRRA